MIKVDPNTARLANAPHAGPPHTPGATTTCVGCHEELKAGQTVQQHIHDSKAKQGPHSAVWSCEECGVIDSNDEAHVLISHYYVYHRHARTPYPMRCCEKPTTCFKEASCLGELMTHMQQRHQVFDCPILPRSFIGNTGKLLKLQDVCKSQPHEASQAHQAPHQAATSTQAHHGLDQRRGTRKCNVCHKAPFTDAELIVHYDQDQKHRDAPIILHVNIACTIRNCSETLETLQQWHNHMEYVHDKTENLQHPVHFVLVHDADSRASTAAGHPSRRPNNQHSQPSKLDLNASNSNPHPRPAKSSHKSITNNIPGSKPTSGSSRHTPKSGDVPLSPRSTDLSMPSHTAPNGIKHGSQAPKQQDGGRLKV